MAPPLIGISVGRLDMDPVLETNKLLEHDSSRESDEEYLVRLRSSLPHFPNEVLKDWLVRHGDFAFVYYGWLDYRQFRFSREEWPTGKLLDLVTSGNERDVDYWTQELRKFPEVQQEGLGAFMISKGTWPSPPLILDNAHGLQRPSGQPLSRYHLLEGHHRLAFLRGIATNPRWQVAPSHELWLVTYDATRPQED
ncbi:MAG TPA: hypothetical protein VMW27_02460 [Thermoanaerobaculia bacterium]|nr:hypothetical protein [Thermoanaerobaculia bacterium]